MPERRKRLRELLKKDNILIVPGAYDAISARMVEKLGFDAVYMTGGGVCVAQYGLPDHGLLTLTEMVECASRIVKTVSVPVISDADTGYGGVLNVERTVKEFESAGVCGIHIEDQVSPKRCGHLQGKEVVSQREMIDKIKAAVEARKDRNFLIIARTDARSPLGFEEAVKRGQVYLEAGADMVFPEALESKEEFKIYSKEVNGDLLANMTEFGKSPYISAKEFEQMGYKIVIFPVTTLRMAMKAVFHVLKEIKETGSQKDSVPLMYTRDELYELIGYDEHLKKYV
ncbi:MAG: methylisocitrate lyase [Campylobacterota bacterium]|nr:methylisocitrate lyase [Campylobacterota bacterium]